MERIEIARQQFEVFRGQNPSQRDYYWYGRWQGLLGLDEVKGAWRNVEYRRGFWHGKKLRASMGSGQYGGLFDYRNGFCPDPPPLAGATPRRDPLAEYLRWLESQPD
jgi:hypothetical protein